MTASWPAVTAPLLDNGPAVAFLAAFAISPGMHVFLALALERRLIRPSEQFTALIFGDPLLCFACGLGAALASGHVPGPVRFAATPAAIVLSAVLWLLFGLWQWYTEWRTGFYTTAQALAPTKIWHQLIVYPVFGTLVTFSCLAGLATPPGGHPAIRLIMKMFMAACALAWALMNIYDRRHPRYGHPPFDWRHIRPVRNHE